MVYGLLVFIHVVICFFLVVVVLQEMPDMLSHDWLDENAEQTFLVEVLLHVVQVIVPPEGL